MLDRGQDDGRRSAFPLQVEGMTSLVNTPAVILAAPNHVGCFPKVLAIVPDPDVAGLRVATHAPGVAQPVGPDFGARSGRLDEWIVRRNSVGLCTVATVDIDAQHAAEQVVDGLTRVPSV